MSHLPYGPTVSFTLSGAVLRHDIEGVGPVSEAAPHLIFSGFATPLGARVRAVLSALFPPPKPDSARVLTFANERNGADPRVNLGYALAYPVAMIVKVIVAPLIGRM